VKNLRFKKDEVCENCVSCIVHPLKTSFTYHSCKELDIVVIPYKDKCILFEHKNEK